MDEATEFSRRRNLPFAQVQHMSAGRTADVVVTLGGKVIASRTEILKRGKVCQTGYFLPALEAK